jgi:hypothetical protein
MTPVEVVVIVTACPIALSPKTFDPKLWAPALKGTGASLDAADGVSPGNDSDVRVTD